MKYKENYDNRPDTNHLDNNLCRGGGGNNNNPTSGNNRAPLSTQKKDRNNKLTITRTARFRNKRDSKQASYSNRTKRYNLKQSYEDGVGSTELRFYKEELTTTADQDLWLGVLMLALIDLKRKEGGVNYTNRLRREAQKWILDNKHCVGSFLWICEQLNLDPQTLRKKIIKTSYLTTLPKLKSGVKIKRHQQLR